ncbi:DUF1345 domain-containing protein [Massilia sp. DWR3-1-1]|uniref:DUF1345 domain-containing protein n=1 Tax=Massilia sp. DWR3-1-1 TaxID=2804559 RepID=UPI003CEC91A3
MNSSTWHSFISSRPNMLASTLIGAVTAAALPADMHWVSRALIAWNVAVWCFLIIMMRIVVTSDSAQVNARADKEDENAGVVLLVLVIASVCSLTAIFVELAQLADARGAERAGRYALTVSTLIGSWLLVGVLFCFHYAHKYYRCDGTELPLKFPDDEEQPDYWDFLYFSFTISVAVQTSDVQVMGSKMRKLVLGHSVLNFFFNLVVLGLSINIAAGLLKS